MSEKLPRQFLNDKEEVVTGPHTGLFLYGLICAVLKSNKRDREEALLPWDDRHSPKLFSVAPHTGERGTRIGTTDLYTWDLAGKAIKLIPLDSAGDPITVTPAQPNPRERRDRHPWSHFSAVRSLKKLTGKAVIDKDEELNDPNRVTCRISLSRADVEPVIPMSALGRVAEFEADDAMARRKVVSATTDTLLAVNTWPAQTAKIRVAWTMLADWNQQNPTVKSVDFTLVDSQAVLIVTHAAPPPSQRMMVLEHTKAYGKLLQNLSGNYPVPCLRRRAYGETSKECEGKGEIEPLSSSKDGHCEVSWDGP